MWRIAYVIRYTSRQGGPASKVTVFEPDGHGSFGKIFDRFEDAIAFLNQQGWEPMSASLDHEGVYWEASFRMEVPQGIRKLLYRTAEFVGLRQRTTFVPQKMNGDEFLRPLVAHNGLPPEE
jgi:hypothetical protein